MTVPFRMPYARCLPPVCAAVLAAVLTGCAGEPGPEPSPGGDASGAVVAATGTTQSPEASGSTTPDRSATSTQPAGNDVAPYGDAATRDAAATFGSTQQVTDSLEAVVEGPRPEITGDRPVRAAPGSPVQVFTLTLTNTGTESVNALPWSFPVAVAGDAPATPAFDESLGVQMETFSTLAPGESASLDVAFSAPHDADLAVRVFDNTEPDHYVAFTD